MSRDTFNLDGAVVAITGGARGIGKATAEAFARNGARVAIGDLDATLAKQAAIEIGHGAVALALDVTDRPSVDAFIAQTEEQLGPIQVYVNNAGIGPVALIGDESDALAERIFAINVHGTLHGMKAVLPGMLARGRGHIVNVASAAGKIAFPGAASYCASKHAVVGITEAARLELHTSPVRLSLVLPGVANTELASGVKGTRGVPRAEPEEIATAIVDAVRNDRFEVFVPRRLGPISKLMTVLPRTPRELIVRALGLDRMLLEVDESARRAYNERIMPSSQAPEHAVVPRND
jgi:NAD(P)-dependent dehydrogenase (short-subunit alcohol dehydrogenase family)